MSPRDQRVTVDSTDSRLRPILDPTYLNYALNQVETTLTIAAWLDAGYLVVLDLDQSEMGIDTARAFANLVLGALVNDIVQRPGGQSALPWRLIVDEATELTTEPFAEQIEQMRDRAVYPVFAHQNWEQLDEPRNHRLRRAARLADVSINLALSSYDAATLRRMSLPDPGSIEDIDPSDLEQYEATVVFARRPRGTRKRYRLRLYPLTAPEIPGRLDEAEAKQLQLTRPATAMRYLYKDGTNHRLVRRQGLGAHHDDQSASTPPPRPPGSDAGAPRRDESDPVRMGDAGGVAPVSLADLVASGEALLPGYPSQTGEPRGDEAARKAANERCLRRLKDCQLVETRQADSAAQGTHDAPGVSRPDSGRVSAPARSARHARATDS